MESEGRILDITRLTDFVSADPVTAKVAEATGDGSLFLVGGSVRDLLIGSRPAELDFVVEGPVDVIAERLDPEARIFDRFGTAEATVDGWPVDLVTARRETYPEPGALPEVEPADIEADLARRDFTVNAIAIPVGEGGAVIDPFDGMDDLRRGVLRYLHEDSFIDDPTRALRAARYSARLGLTPEPRTLSGLGQVDLSKVSRERVDREFELMAGEDDPARALLLLAEWGVVELDPAAAEVAEASFRLLRSDDWRDTCTSLEVLEELLSDGGMDRAGALLDEPVDPWAGYSAIRSAPAQVVLIARAAGAEWVDRWPEEWQDLELRISGEDLIEAGVSEGPAVGRGLEAALRDRVLNGDGGRERELSVALAEVS